MDRTFCVNKECSKECGRKLTKEVIEAAHKWWGSEDAPIAQADFNCSPIITGGS